MKAFFNNFTGSNISTETKTGETRVFRKQPPANRSNAMRGRRRDFMQERLNAQEQERRIREAENKRIRQLNEHIENMSSRMAGLNMELAELIQANLPENADLIESLGREVNQLMSATASLSNQISSIHTARAEREQTAIERELVRQQQELEERMRERERIAREQKENRLANKTDEELEAVAERSNIRNLTAIGQRMDTINSLSRTRASLRAEAGRLEGEANFEVHRQRISNSEILAHVRRENANALVQHRERVENAKAAAAAGIALAVAPPRLMEVGHLFSGNPLGEDSFRGRHLQNLNEGIARTTAGIQHHIGALYRDSQNMQEEQLRIYREKSRVPGQDEDCDDEGRKELNFSFDLRL